MKEFMEYINSIDISTVTLGTKIDMTLKAARKTCPEEILDIFISDRVDNEGSRSYEHLYLFTKTYIIEVANFSTDPSLSIELTILKDRVRYVLVKFDEYFEKASEKSRLAISCHTDAAHFEFKAAKENCNKLFEVYEKYIRPNISQISIPGWGL